MPKGKKKKERYWRIDQVDSLFQVASQSSLILYRSGAHRGRQIYADLFLSVFDTRCTTGPKARGIKSCLPPPWYVSQSRPTPRSTLSSIDSLYPPDHNFKLMDVPTSRFWNTESTWLSLKRAANECDFTTLDYLEQTYRVRVFRVKQILVLCINLTVIRDLPIKIKGNSVTLYRQNIGVDQRWY